MDKILGAETGWRKMKEYLISQLQENGIPFNDTQIEKLIKYHALLLDWNQKINLTSIVEDREVVQKHYVDSLLLITLGLDFEKKMFVDVGTGAGFPGLPLSIFLPNAQFCLLDSLQKRVAFLETVKKELDLQNVSCIHMRSEEAGQNPLFREKFDFALSRAVAKLNVLNEYLLPFVKVGGFAIAYKANVEDDEINAAAKSLYLLGGNKYKMIPAKIANTDYTRNFVLAKKDKKTPKSYPRKAGTPQKSPIV